jgi:16S rRNA C967 or C1407 C5-methylase (RsmB/RsmF family)/NOL1/NOP2/fmu family ribosome biogenesis protein
MTISDSEPVILPPSYLEQMRNQLGHDEAIAFLLSYKEPRTYGLRLNPLKLSAAPSSLFPQIEQQFGLSRIPWCTTGFYYDENTRPGKHAYHAAGLYYLQEPSAMSSAELLAPQPGETVLDLAAAPGGKTTQIAGMMRGAGLLVANEIHPARARILSENVERMGIANAIVTQAAPDELSARFPAFFDCIMLDAPCSGEGMFRKDPDAIREWSPKHVDMCAARQADILDHAAIMLKPGGRLAYSTCTFNRAENEDTIEAFIQRHPGFTLVKIERIWPHQDRGEGHFVALLRKNSDSAADEQSSGRTARDTTRPHSRSTGRTGSAGSAPASLASDMKLFRSFADSALPDMPSLGNGEPVRFGDRLFWLPHDRTGRMTAGSLEGLRVVRPGLHLGDIRKGRIEPAHALALHLSAAAAAWVQSYAADSPEIAAYLRGESLPAQEGSAGWGLIAADGYPLGWSKASGGQAKNHLPRGLRRP